MNKNEIIKSIAERTNGDIYLGVVGAVRTGKSTFIKKFMENMVIPNIEDEYEKKRIIDELPQSAAGKQIMTTEPKFIPNEAIAISLDDNVKMKARLVDCVGYLVNNAIGHMENDMPRMVKTPWSDDEMPFELAAELGTKKVITEHSTIGIVVTTDGSITDIPREDYMQAEERVVSELKALNKPFVMILNTAFPYSEETTRLAKELEEKYETQVIPMSCLNMTIADVNNIFTKLLYEFLIERINIKLPRWVSGLSLDNSLKQELFGKIKDTFKNVKRIKDVKENYAALLENENIKKVEIGEINLGTGIVTINIELQDSLFYSILSEITGVEIQNEGELFNCITEFAKVKKEYDKMEYAIHEVYERGYGIVTPTMDDLILEEPEIVKQGQKYGVKLKAKAPSIHMLKIDTETEISPIVGSEKQSEELVKYLLSEFESDPQKIWESNIFGKSIHELVNEGLQNKLSRMPEDAQNKLRDTLQRIVNEGSGGLICIIL